MQNSYEWCLQNLQLLRTTVNWCWWRFTHSLCHGSNILGCTHCFLVFTLLFIDEDASFFHFFHKITNIRGWRWFSSFKIHTQFSHIFCNISQRCSTTFVQRKDKTYYLSSKTKLKCYHYVRWRTQYKISLLIARLK